MKKGFSILELVVAIGIFLVLTFTVLINYGRVNSRVALDTQAEKLSVAIREAQAYAVTIRQQVAVPNTSPGYGIIFTLATPNRYVLYVDKDNSRTYDAGDGCGGVTTECLESRTIDAKGGVIAALCGDDPPSVSASGICAGLSGMPVQNEFFDINFTQHDSTAQITGQPSSGGPISASYRNAKIVIVSPRGEQRVVSAWLTGQIAVGR